MLVLILRNPEMRYESGECFYCFWHQWFQKPVISELETGTESSSRFICEGKKADEEVMFGCVGVFPGCFNRLKCWLAYQLRILHGFPPPPPALQRPGLLLDTHVLRIATYTQSQTPCFLFVQLLFSFYLFPMFSLCCLFETCSVVDLFKSDLF